MSSHRSHRRVTQCTVKHQRNGQKQTAENLRNHIQYVLVQWGLESELDIVTTNFNSTNAYDIEDEAEAPDAVIDYLQEVGYYDEEKEEDEATGRGEGIVEY